MITLSLQQLALIGTGAALGGLIFGVMGFAYGVVISLFIHHGFAAAASSNARRAALGV